MIAANRKANVYFNDRLAGVLEETGNGYRFAYDDGFLSSNTPVSASLPVRKEPFESRELFGFFEGLLPEGWYLDIVTKSLKIDKNDKFGILIKTCGDTIGAVRIEEIR